MLRPAETPTQREIDTAKDKNPLPSPTKDESDKYVQIVDASPDSTTTFVRHEYVIPLRLAASGRMEDRVGYEDVMYFTKNGKQYVMTIAAGGPEKRREDKINQLVEIED